MEIKRGEIYKVDLAATVGSEMKKDRSGVIVSVDEINKHAATVIICPITDASGKDSPIHVFIPGDEGGLKKDSVAHCGQVRAIDKSRLGNRIGELSSFRLAKVGRGLRDAMGLNF